MAVMTFYPINKVRISVFLKTLEVILVHFAKISSWLNSDIFFNAVKSLRRKRFCLI